MNLFAPQNDIIGKITGSFERIKGCEPVKPNALYRLILDTVTEKACYELSSQDYSELIKCKGVTKAELNSIYNHYRENKKGVDVFYVAFSGGKDSVVALDLVQQALPHDEFLVLFGDTRMEFSDTYKVVAQIEELCHKNGIRFYRAQSNLPPERTWQIFGPPSTTNRWCCSVHKTSPQINLLRKITGKHDFTGMAFTGVRGAESQRRSEYDEVSEGKKHSGQISCHGILDWNSAELFLYIFSRKLILNEAYKKGISRAGCLVYSIFSCEELCAWTGADCTSVRVQLHHNDSEHVAFLPFSSSQRSSACPPSRDGTISRSVYSRPLMFAFRFIHSPLHTSSYFRLYFVFLPFPS